MERVQYVWVSDDKGSKESEQKNLKHVMSRTIRDYAFENEVSEDGLKIVLLKKHLIRFKKPSEYVIRQGNIFRHYTFCLTDIDDEGDFQPDVEGMPANDVEILKDLTSELQRDKTLGGR